MKLDDLKLKYKNILMICEKPSLAKAVAAALPGKMETSANKLSINTGGITIAMLAGHVMSLAQPGVYDARYKVWDINALPIIIDNWKNIVTPNKTTMFASVKVLIAKADCIINAGDPDREGQLLVDEVIEHCKFKHDVYRFLGGNNIEITALQKSFNDIRLNKEFASLKNSALARQRADWTIGMNLTRLMSLYMQQIGFAGTSNVGRVKTPVMSLVVDNIKTIENFIAVQHYSLKTSYTKSGITFFANWQIPKSMPGLDSENRVIDIDTINKIVSSIKADGEAIVTRYTTDSKKEKHPLCFSQSKLQMAAGKKYGYKPDQTLAICQDLYDQGILTYPRSGKQYIPESQFTDAKHVLSNVCVLSHFSQFKSKINSNSKSRAWSSDEQKTSPHHAIIPTLKKFNYDSLAEPEQNIYNMVATMFIAQFMPEHEYKQTTIELCIADQTFKAVGKTTTNPGWRALFGKDDSDEESNSNDETAQTLPELREDESLPLVSVDTITKKTAPPKPFTQITLIDAMVNIHKFVKDKNLQAILKETDGIGQESTRSSIIKELCENSSSKNIKGEVTKIPALLEERGKKAELYPSAKALKMYEMLPIEIKTPDTTALWEKEFNDIVTSNSDIEPFTRKINALVSGIVSQYRNLITPKIIKPKLEIPLTAKTCPKCKKGKMLLRGKITKFYGCSTFPKCEHTEKIPTEITII
jgi:DNA topoisomerase-3